jgi:hypothetical protein
MRISHLLSFVALALVAIVVYTWWTFDGFSARSQPSAVERGIARAVRRTESLSEGSRHAAF